MKVKIERVEQISPTVRQYFCRSLTKFSFSPGQYLSFFIPKGERAAIRAYSFCSQPDNQPKFELCVKQVTKGVGTTYLATNVGKIVETSEPAGEFVLPDKQQKLIFIAAGTGVAPVRSQIPFWLEKYRNIRVDLHYRYRGDSECLFENEFLSLTRKHSEFSFIKSDSLKEMNWSSELEQRDFLKEATRYYIVGPPKFVSDTVKVTQKKGITEKDISVDIWE